ncbi:hypothetical protein [Limnochorda pilosa]|uniref:Uncharacterized protein n=1 Tax=Limnochorda pilosa TaxID=1555112 RepID=A0A0K2SH87_LIMPI|nr:hypothetical protein [Limnochorda pilosa]BAS26402.1 hypothetical protein LIP_0545 [Limnochorda pilosa]
MRAISDPDHIGKASLETLVSERLPLADRTVWPMEVKDEPSEPH